MKRLTNAVLSIWITEIKHVFYGAEYDKTSHIMYDIYCIISLLLLYVKLKKRRDCTHIAQYVENL